MIEALVKLNEMQESLRNSRKKSESVREFLEKFLCKAENNLKLVGDDAEQLRALISAGFNDIEEECARVNTVFIFLRKELDSLPLASEEARQIITTLQLIEGYVDQQLELFRLLTKVKNILLEYQGINSWN